MNEFKIEQSRNENLKIFIYGQFILFIFAIVIYVTKFKNYNVEIKFAFSVLLTVFDIYLAKLAFINKYYSIRFKSDGIYFVKVENKEERNLETVKFNDISRVLIYKPRFKWFLNSFIYYEIYKGSKTSYFRFSKGLNGRFDEAISYSQKYFPDKIENINYKRMVKINIMKRGYEKFAV